MTIVYGIIGLIIGAFTETWQGALFGLVAGLLCGAQLGMRRDIERLQQRLREVQQPPAEPAGTTPSAGPAPETAPGPAPEKAVAEPGWQHPDYLEPEVYAAELIVPAKGSAHLHDAAPAAASPDAPSPAVSDTAAMHTPGVFEKIETAVKRFFTTGNVVVKVGMIILFIGVSFLLKYAAQKNLFPVELRLAAVAAGGIALLVFGWRLRLRKRIYALVLQGGGIGILYLTVFTAARLYQFLPLGLVFALMVALVVFSCLLAVIQNAQSLAVFATVGGFLAPVLTSTGQGSHVALFSYYGLLNLGILGIAWHRAWRALNWLGFVFTFVIASLWGAKYYVPEFFSSTEPFLVLFFLFYLAIPILYAHRQPPELKGLVDGTLVFGTPLVGFALQSALVRNYEFGQAYSALVMGTLYLLLARVLWHKQLDGMRMLTESFLALAVIFLSLAIPLAMDGHWTAAAWSLEGAGITWVSLRQNRLSGRAFGLLLQVGAGIAFLAAIDLPHGYTPAFNSAFLGSILIGIAGLFTAYQYFVSRDMVRPFEQALHRVLLAWGLAWWFGAGITELEQFVADDYLINALLLYCALSVAALYLLGEKLAWTDTAWPGAGLLPVMAVLAGIGWGDAVLSQPFEKLGYLAWPLAFLVHYLLLYRVRVWPRDLVVSWHAAAQWLLMFLCAWFVSRMLVDHVAGMRSWALVFWGVVPAIIVMLLLNFGTRLRWPIREHAAAYLGGGLLPVIAYLAAWTVVICFRENNPAPLPWVPVLNPYDIAQWFVIFNLFNWCWSLRQGSVPAVAGLRAEPLLMILAAIVFLWLNALVAHTVHFQGGVPFRLYSLMRSEVFQTSISILWTVVALAMMLTATRIHWRRLWFAGGILLGVTLVKLFLVDLADSGTVTRIVSFLTVGGLMLVIGYFSPLPPKHEEDPGAHA